MLRRSVTDRGMEIYKIYCQRIVKEYDIGWNIFKIYFSLNSVLFAASGFIVKGIFKSGFFFPDYQIYILCLAFISVVGVILSLIWVAVSKNSIFWQRNINNILRSIENEIFINPQDLGLYNMVIREAERHKDIIFLRLQTSYLFLSVYIVFFILCVI